MGADAEGNVRCAFESTIMKGGLDSKNSFCRLAYKPVRAGMICRAVIERVNKTGFLRRGTDAWEVDHVLSFLRGESSGGGGRVM